MPLLSHTFLHETDIADDVTEGVTRLLYSNPYPPGILPPDPRLTCMTPITVFLRYWPTVCTGRQGGLFTATKSPVIPRI